MTPEQRQVFAFNLLRQDVDHGGFDFFFRYRGNIGLCARLASFASPAWTVLIDEACALMGVPYPAHGRLLPSAASADPAAGR
jgi:hypothetical protein